MRTRMPRVEALALALFLVPASGLAQDAETPGVEPAPAGIKPPTAVVAGPRVEPVWKALLPGTQLDTLELLPGDRILVGSVRENRDRFVNTPYRRFLDLSLLQASTGALIWRHERDSRIETFDLVAFDPVIIASTTTSGGSTIFAIDPRTGAKLWTKSNLPRIATVPGATMVVAVKLGLLGGASFVALRPADGEELWSVDLPREASRRPPRIDFQDGAAYVISQEIAKINVADGKVLWRDKLPVKWHPLLQVAYAGAVLVLSDGETVAALDAGSGKPAWSSTQEHSLSLAADGNAVYQVVKTAGGFALRGLDASSGAERWRVNEARAFQSALLAEPARLTYTTEFHLVSVHPGTGEELLRTPLPLSIMARDTAPRVLRSEDGIVTVATQAAVSVFDLARGAWALHDEVPNPAGFVRTTLRPEEMEQVRTAVPKAGAAIPRTDPIYGNYRLQQAQQTVDYARREVERARSDPGRDIRQAHGDHRRAIQGQMIVMRSVQAQERSAAWQGLASSVTGALEGITAAMKRMQALRLDWTEADAAHAYAGMLSPDLYVKQRGGQATSLHVVDLRLGARGTLDLLTDKEPGRHWLTIYAVDPENRRIIAMTERPDPSAPLVERFDKQVPSRHLAAFDIGALSLQPVGQRAAGAPRASLMDAIADGNVQMLQIVLKSLYKSDPNRRLGGGANRSSTVLMLAAYAGHPEMVRWLLAQGADASLMDDRGWRAVDYARAANRADIAALLSAPVAAAGK